MMIVKELLDKYSGKYDDVDYYYADARSQHCGFYDFSKGAYCLETLYSDVNPYSLVLDYELMDAGEYSSFSQIPEDCLDGNTLVCVLDTEDGILPGKSIWEGVEKGNISDELLGKVCHTYSKLAKLYRYNRALIYSNYIPDQIAGKDREEKKEAYYLKKEAILDRYRPSEIHYDTAIKNVYLYYSFGGHSFHRPVCVNNSMDEIYTGLKEKGISADNLEIKTLSAFESSTENLDNLLNERFCDFVLQHIIPPHNMSR